MLRPCGPLMRVIDLLICNFGDVRSASGSLWQHCAESKTDTCLKAVGMICFNGEMDP